VQLQKALLVIVIGPPESFAVEDVRCTVSEAWGHEMGWESLGRKASEWCRWLEISCFSEL